ncbi:MAG: thioesterase [Flavobacteriales bacterium]|nr:thioesterase [Flavobacteriales bacterium]|tara:strand:- start:25941 stop:26357 length:417 start_codon:yes stop_codon:yes gene_type:complete
MPRIRLKLPETYHFSTKLTLRIYDMNYGAHMGNDVVLSLVHEARVQFLKSLNLEERNFYGFSLLMADSAVVYKKEGFYGDELDVKISVSELYVYGFELFYLITNGKDEVARVKTGLVCYDKSNKKLIKIPLPFSDLFK